MAKKPTTMCARCGRNPAAVRLTRYSERLLDTAWRWQREPLCRQCAAVEQEAIRTAPGLTLEVEDLDDGLDD